MSLEDPTYLQTIGLKITLLLGSSIIATQLRKTLGYGERAQKPLRAGVLLVGDLFQPVDGFALELFLDGNVGHGGGGAGPVPVLLPGGEADDVSGMDLLDGTAFALGAAGASGDDEGLAQRVSVPGGAGAR